MFFVLDSTQIAVLCVTHIGIGMECVCLFTCDYLCLDNLYLNCVNNSVCTICGKHQD